MLDPKAFRRYDETPDDLLIESFAVVREAGIRVLGQRHYDVQLMGGMALHFGWIAEMKTGEGKTLVSTLPVYLNGLTQADCGSLKVENSGRRSRHGTFSSVHTRRTASCR